MKPLLEHRSICCPRLGISNIQVARKQCLVKFLEAIRAIRQKVKDPDQIEPRVVPGAFEGYSRRGWRPR
jgi:hypothetical protein